MVCDLVQSILQNYYTGLILLWELNPEEAGKEEWEPVWGAKANDRPTTAILDGQQRLASLYYAIYNPRKRFPNRQSYYLFFLDLNGILNGEYDEAVTYRYSSTHRGWRHVWIDKEHYAKDGILPLAMLSAPSPDDANKRYIDSTDFETWISQYVAANRDKLPEDVTTHRVYQRLKDVLDYHFVFYPLSSRRNLPDIWRL
jgi:hypothetical protein